MDLVATRDIEPGEEIFLDYSSEFEAAWQEHVRNWKPVPGAETYLSAATLNTDKSRPLRTEFELIENPIPNVELWCNSVFWMKPHWRAFHANGTLDDFAATADAQIYPCDILRYKEDKDGNYLYSALVWHEDKATKHVSVVAKIEDVPRQAFKYFDRPYTSDTFLENAFRHPIYIPDELFPSIWRNAPRQERIG